MTSGMWHERLRVHDHRQREDRVERPVLEEAVLRERPLLHQHDRHGADVHRPDPEADGDDEEVLGQREGPDHPVEGEGGVEHLEVEEGPYPALRRALQRLLAAVEKPAQHLHEEEGQEPPDGRVDEDARLRRFEKAREEEDEDKDDRHLDPPDRGVVGHLRLEPVDPVHVLFVVEEEGQAHHHQERAAEGRDGQVRVVHDAGVFLGLGGREDHRLDRADLGRDHDDEEREEDPHPEDGDQDAPGQEAALPFGAHRLQLVGVDDGVVEGQRDLEHGEDGHDEEDRQRPPDGAGHLPAENGAEREPDGGDDEGPAEIAERCAVRGHARTSGRGRARLGRGDREEHGSSRPVRLGPGRGADITEAPRLPPEGPGHRKVMCQMACGGRQGNARCCLTACGRARGPPARGAPYRHGQRERADDVHRGRRSRRRARAWRWPSATPGSARRRPRASRAWWRDRP